MTQGTTVTPTDLGEPTYSVVELNQLIAGALVGAFPGAVWVRGEIQQYHVSGNEHAYFELVEKAPRGAQVRARISVALFRGDRPAVNHSLREVPGLRLGDGVEVRIRGRVDFYPPTGRLQLVMNGIDPVFTVGRMAADRERLLRTLADEGLLGANARLPLPDVPLRVGLVTSGGSAAYRDFVHELEGSGYAFRVGLADVRVQGGSAAHRIAYGLRRLASSEVDVIVVVRGGGAKSDLAAFDSEVVARAIAASPVPVLTGIGHEVDRTVADEVAHTAYKTPTACAAALALRVDEFCAHLARISHRVALRARHTCVLAQRQLVDTGRRVGRAVPVGLDRECRALDHRRGLVGGHARRVLGHAAASLSSRARAVVVGAPRRAKTAAAHVATIEALLTALDPRRVLERGYTITRDGHGTIRTRAEQLVPGETLTTEWIDGTAESRVQQVTQQPLDRSGASADPSSPT